MGLEREHTLVRVTEGTGERCAIRERNRGGPHLEERERRHVGHAWRSWASLGRKKRARPKK
jgi:hypothetical protein